MPSSARLAILVMLLLFSIGLLPSAKGRPPTQTNFTEAVRFHMDRPRLASMQPRPRK